MNTETFFTLAEYKSNFERMKNEFVDAYIDNDEGEFIAQQTEWYQRCLENTILEYGIVADSVGWDTKSMITGEGFVKVVDNKVRNERGGVVKEAAQNLNVSFKKIIKYLGNEKEKTQIVPGKPTQVQWALYHYVLQECKIKPRFQYKVKEISIIAEEYGVGFKNLQLKYNQISNSGGQEGYTDDDVNAVEMLLEQNYPYAIVKLRELTRHVM